ncbi:DEAD box RNA helicase, putative [Perkinsus marinus ATCC 50983]|uniref:DEAD box RNA helicase, putative n=1 Tax=Perkinsus marinus (strain ATCC 50983 / TXsc) TaxID=423536 RepID=C5KJY7_PERM5|nr:DEAD box RNA helicase, putative [Perkinsus marinus ATCC 50983]EER15245.1 DEAD box RNA helicase, putative [Perkinsus marinus ATCC 50983]|eukprot:XP_002783449.1 DEAD box RNA helicase, putative [Perkinsus marinus ATCC 50983]
MSEKADLPATPEMSETSSTQENTDAEHAVTFESLGVCPELCKACDVLQWEHPSKIQEETIPYALQGRDLIALAETGSGKTGAFAIPIIQKLLDAAPHRKLTWACVLAPTRELCVQIGQQFEGLGASINLTTATIVGGLDMVTQAMSLSKKPHIIVASPGRLVDHLENTKGFHLKTIKFLVMDEADRLLGMDFEDALNKIVQSCPRDRQTFLFSATMTNKVSQLQRASLTRPVKCEVARKFDVAKGLVQNYMFVPHKHKHAYLAALLAHFKLSTVMIFVDTCLNAQRMATTLRHLGHNCVCLHGKMTQTHRLGALNQFRAGTRSVLVATDVAARGLDIPSVDVVINFDVPKNPEEYIHRVGRTARAGRTGRSVTLVTQYDIEPFQRIENKQGKKMEEFPEVKEENAISLQEKVLEALRSTQLEMREQEEDIKEALAGKKGGRGGRKRQHQMILQKLAQGNKNRR